ncbi:hypothetical protein EVA_14712 [gut metagenome]|uniref:Uncharacterized protein n=1 Tax=gut metagenome TaxID=749906 RepID=J9G5V7_9ZZZZ
MISAPVVRFFFMLYLPSLLCDLLYEQKTSITSSPLP